MGWWVGQAARERLQLEWLFGFLLAYLLLSAVIKGVDAYLFLTTESQLGLHPLRLPWSLPLLFGEDLLVGAAWGLGLSLLRMHRFTRWAAHLLTGLLLFYLVADQLAYKYYFSHVTYGLFSQSQDVALLSSIADSLDFTFWILAPLSVGLTVALALPAVLRRITPALVWASHRMRWMAGGLLCYLLISLGLPFLEEQHGLNRTAFVEVVRTTLQALDRTDAQLVDRSWERQQPIMGQAGPPEDFSELTQLLTQPRERLNVILYIGESLALHESSVGPGPDPGTTPFLGRLAREGLSFQNHHCLYPSSTKSDFSLNTGRYPYMTDSNSAHPWATLAIPILADLLHDAGWTTAMFSSSDSKYDSWDLFLLNHRFDRFVDTNTITQQERNEHMVNLWGTDEEFMLRAALRWIEEQHQAGRPFFLQYKANFPHHPYPLPPGQERFMEGRPRTAKGRYLASLAYVDATLEWFWEELRRVGAAEDTLLIITVDHGEAFGDRHPRNLIHSLYTYQENLQIPLIFHNKRLFPRPRVSHRLSTTADLMPTLLELLGIPERPTMHGQSLVSERYRERPFYFSGQRQWGIRDGHLKCILDREAPRAELFDLQADPLEQRNLAHQHPELVTRYRALVAGWGQAIEEQYEQLRQQVQEPPAAREQRLRALRTRAYGQFEDPVARVEICSRNPTRPKTGAALTCPGSREALDPDLPVAIRIHWNRNGAYAGIIHVWDPAQQRSYERVFYKETNQPAVVTIRRDPPLRQGRWKVSVNMGGAEHVVRFRVGRSDPPTDPGLREGSGNWSGSGRSR